MRKFALVLFVSGLILEAAAFLLSNADDFPIVLGVVSRDYALATQGLNSLESGNELLPNMVGFEECADPYLAILRQQNPPEVLSGISITRFFHPPRVEQGFNVNRGVSTKRPLEIFLSNGEKIDSTVEALEIKINRLKKGSLLFAAVVAFFIGVALQVIGFTIERRSERAST